MCAAVIREMSYAHAEICLKKLSPQVKSTHRFHIIKKLKPFVKKSKERKKRGKFRAATTTVGEGADKVTLTEILWNDSSLVGCVSADLGSEEHRVQRRMGRHTPTIAQPNMFKVRDMHYRAVDQNDQLRMSKWTFPNISRRVCWHKLFFALIEVLLINIYIIALQEEPDLKQDDYRWALLLQLVGKADELDEGAVAARTRSACREQREAEATPPVPESVGRWEGGETQHHHDRVFDYVTPEQALINQRIVDADPGNTKSTKSMRRRDRFRKDGKVRNPMFTSASQCVVCRYAHNRVTWTTKYCRECQPAPGWPQTNRATGFRRLSHPRLCSTECFKYFHTHRIAGLDYGVQKSRRTGRRSARNRARDRRGSQEPRSATGSHSSTGSDRVPHGIPVVQNLIGGAVDAVVTNPSVDV